MEEKQKPNQRPYELPKHTIKMKKVQQNSIIKVQFACR